MPSSKSLYSANSESGPIVHGFCSLLSVTHAMPLSTGTLFVSNRNTLFLVFNSKFNFLQSSVRFTHTTLCNQHTSSHTAVCNPADAHNPAQNRLSSVADLGGCPSGPGPQPRTDRAVLPAVTVSVTLGVTASRPAAPGTPLVESRGVTQTGAQLVRRRTGRATPQPRCLL